MRRKDAPADLAAVLSRGDARGALVLLMNEYGDLVYGYCVRLMGNRGLADDVHQSVFIRAYECIHQLRNADRAREWLISIAHNECMSALRKLHREAGCTRDPEVLLDVPDPGFILDEGDDLPHALKSLEECVAKLKPQVRYAVLLRYQDEAPLTYEEMGRVCREEPKTLQMRVARALPLLRRCLEGKGVAL